MSWRAGRPALPMKTGTLVAEELAAQDGTALLLLPEPNKVDLPVCPLRNGGTFTLAVVPNWVTMTILAMNQLHIDIDARQCWGKEAAH